MTDIQQSSEPRDLQTDVFLINEETIPELMKRTGLTEAYFQSLLRWDNNVGVKAYFFPKLVSPEGFKEVRTETEYVIQYRHPEWTDGEWEDENVVTDAFLSTLKYSIEHYFRSWIRPEEDASHYRLIKRVTERRVAETVMDVKVEK